MEQYQVMPLDWYNLCEQPNYLKNIIYGDTDSIFIFIDEDTKDPKQMVKIARQVSLAVNEKIKSYTKDFILPRLGYASKYNRTSFKEEMIMDACMFLDVKKTYAYRLIAKEALLDENGKLIKGKILDNPEIVPTSNLGIKTDVLPFTNKLLASLLEIALNPKNNPADKPKMADELITKAEKIFYEKVQNLDFSEIALPCKWGKTKYVISGMKLYNKIVENKFEHSSPGLFFYCKFDRAKIKELKLDIEKADDLTGIVVPYEFEKDIVQNALDNYGITLDVEEQLNTKVKTTTVMRILQLFEQFSR